MALQCLRAPVPKEIQEPAACASPVEVRGQGFRMTQRFNHIVHVQLREIDIMVDVLTPDQRLCFAESHCCQQEHYGRTNRLCDIFRLPKLPVGRKIALNLVVRAANELVDRSSITASDPSIPKAARPLPAQFRSKLRQGC